MAKTLILASAEPLRVEEDGKIIVKLIPTRYMDEENNVYFNVDTVYSFPINRMEDMQKENGSVTVIRVTVPKDTLEADGYAAIIQFIKDKLNMCPDLVCERLGFTEVIGRGPIETAH
jgi:hypothetical protein